MEEEKSLERLVLKPELEPEGIKSQWLKYLINISANLYMLYSAIKAYAKEHDGTKDYKWYLDEITKRDNISLLVSVKHASSCINKYEFAEVDSNAFKKYDDYEDYKSFVNMFLECGLEEAYSKLSTYLCYTIDGDPSSEFRKSFEKTYPGNQIYYAVETLNAESRFTDLSFVENHNIDVSLRWVYINLADFDPSSKGKAPLGKPSELVTAASVLYDYKYHVIAYLDIISNHNNPYVTDEGRKINSFIIDCLKYKPYGEHYISSLAKKSAVIFNLISKFKIYNTVQDLNEALKELN